MEPAMGATYNWPSQTYEDQECDQQATEGDIHLPCSLGLGTEQALSKRC